MTARPTVRQVGGDRIEGLLRGITTTRGRMASIEVGFFESARYPDRKGTPVAAVAAWHEFGAPKVNLPSRPFFRQALPDIATATRAIVHATIDPKTMTIPDFVLNQIGAKAAALLQKSIVDIKTPPLSGRTLARRRARHRRPANRRFGEVNPLIDTGHMRRSVTWRLNESGDVTLARRLGMVA